MLDRAVLAGRVHRLEHGQHRPAVLRVELLLQRGQPLDAVGEHRLGVGLLDVEPAGVGRIEIGEAELVRPVDAEALDDLGELHGGVVHAARRLVWRSTCASDFEQGPRHNARHARVAGRRGESHALMRMSAELRLRCCASARNARMRCAQRVGVLARLDDLHQREPLAERRREPAGLRRRIGQGRARSPRVSSRMTPRLEIDAVAHDIVRVGRAGRKVDLAGGRRVAAHLRRAGTRRRHERNAAIAKQLRIVLSGKPQSRQAMKLAKSVSRYAPLSMPSAISPWRSSSTRPFHISGFSTRSLAKCASISARRSTAKRQATGSKRRSSRVSGMIGISSM